MVGWDSQDLGSSPGFADNKLCVLRQVILPLGAISSFIKLKN